MAKYAIWKQTIKKNYISTPKRSNRGCITGKQLLVVHPLFVRKEINKCLSQ